MSDLDQTLCFARRCACNIHPACVAEPAVNDHCHIDIQNVAVFQLFIAWNTVTDHMVDRNTAGVLVAFVANGRGYSASILNHLCDQPVKLACGLTGENVCRDLIKDVCCQSPRFCHTGKVVCFVNADAFFGEASFVRFQRSVFLFSPCAHIGEFQADF